MLQEVQAWVVNFMPPKETMYVLLVEILTIEIIASKRINQKITSTIQVVSKRIFYLKRETLLRL